MTKLKLTPLGEFVRLHTSATPTGFWSQLMTGANEVNDADGDLDFFFAEKIDGLIELRENFHQIMFGSAPKEP